MDSRNSDINVIRGAFESDRDLKRHITTRTAIIMSVMGGIGTGIFFSNIGLISLAGPGSMVTWVIAWLLFTPLALIIGELARVFPTSGSSTIGVFFTYGKITALIAGLASLLWYIFIAGIEALAVVEGFDYYIPSLIASNGNPTFYGVLLGIILLIIFIPINFFGVKALSTTSSLYGGIKWIWLALVGILMIFLSFNLKNFTNYGGYFPFGASPLLVAVPLAIFGVGGARVISDFAGELKTTKQFYSIMVGNILGQISVTLLFGFVFVGALNWSKLGIIPGNWGALESVPGNAFITLASFNAPLLILMSVIAIASPFMTGFIFLGSGSRVAYAMSKMKLLSHSLSSVHKRYSVPNISLIVSAIVASIIVLISAPVPNIYGLLTDSVVAGYLGYSLIPFALLSSRKHGSPRDRWLTKGKLSGYALSIIAFVSASLIVFWSGWPSDPYAILILTIGALVFAVIFKVKENLKNSLWLIGYIVFMLVMSYIGSVGALSIIDFLYSTIIVVVVSAIVFFPLGVFSIVDRPKGDLINFWQAEEGE